MKKTLLLLSSTLLMAVPGTAQTVTTVSGNPGVSGWSATSVSISTAEYTDPHGIVVDNIGRIWITESGATQRVRLIDFGSGTVYNKTGYFGDPANAGNYGYINASSNLARYNGPRGIDIGPNGEFYIADFENHVIRKVTASPSAGTVQVVSTFAGEAPPGGNFDLVDANGTNARFNGPVDVAVDANGNVYVADNFNECIRKITPNGDVSTLAGFKETAGDVDGIGGAARFNNITSIAIYDANHIIVCDSWNNKIRKVNVNTGEVTTVAGLGAANMGNTDGNVSVATFRYPTGVAVDGAGNIYVCEGGDGQSNLIRRISNGEVSTIAGAYQASDLHLDGQGTAARFFKPMLMAFNSAKNELYVTDMGNHAIRKIDLKPVSRFVAAPTSTNVGVLVSFTDQSLNNPATWAWNITPNTFTFENGTNASSQAPKLKFTQAGSYTVKLTVTNSYGSADTIRNSYINVSATSATDPPVANFTASKTTGVPGDIIQFLDQSTNQPIQWKWTIIPATHSYQSGTTNLSQNPFVQFTAVQKYTVILEATNSIGSDTEPKTNYIDISPLGQETLELKNIISIFPNPSNGTVYVEASNGWNVPSLKVQVYDVQGKLVQQNSWNYQEGQLEITDLKQGFYLIKVSDGFQHYTEKVLIR